jgi:serine/threonine protein kinase
MSSKRRRSNSTPTDKTKEQGEGEGEEQGEGEQSSKKIKMPRYIKSKEDRKFLQIPKYNDKNIELGQYLQSGKFASVYSIKDNPNLVCRITHTFLKKNLRDEELQGLRIQKELANHSNNIVKIYEFDMYRVSNPKVAKDYCREREREPGKPPRRDDWCILHETKDPEKQQKEKNKIDARKYHFLRKYSPGIYAVMERIKSDLFDHYGSSHRKLSIEEEIDDMYSIFVQLMTVVSYIHSRAYVHRDIKPENIGIVFEEGKIKIKLIDFGFAVNTTDLTAGVRKDSTDGYYDHDLYTHSRSFMQDTIFSLLYYIPSRGNLNKENLELSDVYACCISMFYIAAYIFKRVNKKQDFETFKSIRSDVQTRQGIIQKGIEDISLTDVSHESQIKFIYMLKAISGCVGLRDNRLTAGQLLQHLNDFQSKSGGKKKTRNKKSKKMKSKKTKTNKKKTNKNKTKKKKTLV